MMKIRKGTSTLVTVQLLDEESKEPLDLSNATQIELRLIDPETRTEVKTLVCSIINATEGIIAFEPEEINIGIYQRKFIITYMDGSVLVLPNTNREWIMVWDV